MTGQQTPSEEPWLLPVTEMPSRIREFFSDLFAGNHDEMKLVAGVITVPLAIFALSFVPFYVSLPLFSGFASFMGLICLWASRSRQGFSQFFRGMLVSLGLMWFIVSLTVLYWIWMGHAVQQSPIERFEATPSSYERPDPRWIA